jgi:Arc/MetJ-type ribon-helix-helix transcriptional regulator
MSTVSVPLKPSQEEAIQSLIKNGYGANKADVLRNALERFIEDVAVMAVLRAEQDVAEGKVFYGDLRKLLKKI